MTENDIAATDAAAKTIRCLEGLTRAGEDNIWRTAKAALELIKAQRVQNNAYRTLNRFLEQELAVHRARASDYYAAIATLDSERAANAILTAEITRLNREDSNG